MRTAKQENTAQKTEAQVQGIVPQSAVKKQNGLRKVIALVLSFLAMVLLLSEISTFILYAVPMIGVQMFQMTGIGIEAGLTFNEFTVSDFSVMFMMWIMPCIFFIGISIWAHCKLISFTCRKISNWLRIVFASSKKS